MYERETFRRATVITSSEPCEVDERGLEFRIRIDAHAEWSTTIDVFADLGGTTGEDEPSLAWHATRSRPSLAADLSRWVDHAPRLECDWEPLTIAYRRSLVDLAALRFSPLSAGRHTLPAAGLPWFMTMFGRDSIITSLQALPFTPDLAATTLRELALRQGTRIDDFRDEDPGRILHEMRYGELTAFAERPHSPYYGSADSTPLFVVLLDEYERWTGDTKLVRDLEFEARAALAWIDDVRQPPGQRLSLVRDPKPRHRAPQPVLEGLARLDLVPRRRAARLPARDVRAPGLRLRRQAARRPPGTRGLARRRSTPTSSNARPPTSSAASTATSGSPTVSTSRSRIEPDGRKVDSLTSNIGHLLWSGIVDKSKAKAVARHLTGEPLYSGWGVRTLAVGEARYNPIGYHVGTVWPFDNSLIALGLRRYGFKDEAACIAAGILEATQFFEGRLPEAFAGYPRTMTKYPVQYPTACSPQAWSSGAPLMLLTAMLGLEPHGDHLVVDPALPSTIGRIELLDIPGRWGRRRRLRPRPGRARQAPPKRPRTAREPIARALCHHDAVCPGSSAIDHPRHDQQTRCQRPPDVSPERPLGWRGRCSRWCASCTSKPPAASCCWSPTAVALVWANSRWQDGYESFWSTTSTSRSGRTSSTRTSRTSSTTC